MLKYCNILYKTLTFKISQGQTETLKKITIVRRQSKNAQAPELRELLEREDIYKMDAMQAKKAGVWRKDLDFGTIFDPGGSTDGHA